ncbi:MAG: hypothetical protein HOD43_12590 [Candidatus Marinimicrobia bacterium]|jgi:phosphate uptake regulator|nr:hypothetical protein [Candidatus Neomarinimicrobiota bacterium]MBT3630156.1 hypothetical protein [Candidatus Neomarinimicrobiota bacterium]MBT3826108.1 hypothetical protein [Candidatus Neomarinimicrobiota bacterium]MBT4132142.1 hypothetical protein [Candidatus Neomarinimicrobiota bacterium]MBT4296629.1 hypothetical protein [Candidatus Neomarinimicrobiota bacterium]
MWKEIRNLWTSDNLLNEAWDLTYEAINIDAEMFNDATDALWGDNRKKIQKLIFKKDKLINKYERDIRRKVITHLTVQGNESIAAGLVLSTVIVDVERIGDYIKNIVDLTEMHPAVLEGKNSKIKLQGIESSIKTMFKKAPECIESGDEDVALDIYSKTKEIGRTCDKNIKMLIETNEENLNTSIVAVLVLYFRYLKRINAHLRNIISSVINPYDRIGFKPKKKS